MPKNTERERFSVLQKLSLSSYDIIKFIHALHPVWYDPVINSVMNAL